MNWKTLPDAPERAKHHSGRDPADDPEHDDSHDLEIKCEVCRQWSFADETDDKGRCPNCR